MNPGIDDASPLAAPAARRTDPAFVHLRLHSEYSISDGMVRIDPAVGAAARDAQPALALTDLSNFFGLIRFYKAARAAGVKPIAGCDVWIAAPAGDTAQRTASRAVLLAKDRAGYLVLCNLLSRAYLETARETRAEVRFEWLREIDTSGLVALSGAAAGDVGLALASGRRSAALAHAARWAETFPRAYYLEVQRYGQPDAEAGIDGAISVAAELGLPVVATHPVQFLARAEYVAHEARTCIAEGEILANPRRTRRYTPEQYLKSQAEMAALFADLPSALANSVEIAKRCNLELELDRPRLPRFPTPAGRTLDEHLALESEAKLAQRLEQLYPDAGARDGARPRYRERLAFEIETITRMGFPGYFLIVADFINWAKRNGVPVGPGRGSGAGSLVAYSLGITDLDPLAYDLLFERFLNPERVSMPDFDIDFCQEGRDRVIDYVKRKYGAESVAQIATFGTMAAKAAVRDVGRVLDLPYGLVDGIAKLIPFQPGRLVTIADARREEPLLAEREAKEDEVREVLALAEQVEGLTRNVGMHAGGVLIAPGKLTDFTPLYAQPGSPAGAGVVSQYDKDDVESAGLVKFDFLGLTTLTILDWTAAHIRARYDDRRDFVVERIPLDDQASYEVFRRAETVAVFQFESPGMRRMLVDARPDRFEDVMALNALFRPGPMALISDFCARKHGARFEYPDPRVAHVLEETYGIMVYQEQVMQMARILGGYSLGGADLLRRAMGKKKKEEMDRHESIFVAGAQKNGLSASHARDIFELMAKFAGYGFNKSHAAAYALLAVQTAWLKVHFAAEFMAANLSAAQEDTDKVKVLVEDARRMGLVVLPPDVNASEARFAPIRQASDAGRARTIRYGLCAVKGTGQSAIASIVAAREAGGPFEDLFDLCARVDKRLVNRRVVEALARGGALDALAPAGRADRATLYASIGRAMDAAEHAETHANQVSLFGGFDEPGSRPALAVVPAWDEKHTLAEEKVALGFYFSGHLFSDYAKEVRRFVRTPLASVAPGWDAQMVAGVVASCQSRMTRRGKMLIVVLDDGTAQLEATIYNELYERHRTRLREDEIVVLSGVVRNDEFTGGVRMAADAVLDLATARARYARGLRLRMNGASDAGKLRHALAPFRAGASDAAEGCRVVVAYASAHDPSGAACEVELGDDWRVKVDDALLGGLAEWLAPENVSVVYP